MYYWIRSVSSRILTIKAHKMDEEETPPLMQRILDNPFILLFLGVAAPAVLYLIWGIMEIISVPVAN
jgi:hypothetical protein